MHSRAPWTYRLSQSVRLSHCSERSLPSITLMSGQAVYDDASQSELWGVRGETRATFFSRTEDMHP